MGFGGVGVSLGKTPGEKVRNAVGLGLMGVGIHPGAELATNAHGADILATAAKVAGGVISSKPAEIALGLGDDIGLGAESIKRLTKKTVKYARTRMSRKPKMEVRRVPAPAPAVEPQIA